MTRNQDVARLTVRLRSLLCVASVSLAMLGGIAFPDAGFAHDARATPGPTGSHTARLPARFASRLRTAIVGGSAAAVGTWPSAAFVANVTLGEICTGTVIASNVVLTAAHCAEDLTTGVVNDPSEYRIVTGAVDWTNTSTRVISTVSQVIVYPGFDRSTLNGDAALLVLAAPVNAPAVALATPADVGLLQSGTAGAIAGWGLTDGAQTTAPTVLQWAVDTVQTSAYCAQQETADGVPFNPATAFCAIDPPSFTVGACHGDSGGPALAQRADQSLVQIGITSRGDPNCNTNYPSVFTRVDTISSWANAWIVSLQPTSAPSLPLSTAPVPPPAAAPSTPPAPTPAAIPPSGPTQPGLPFMTMSAARADVRSTLRGAFRRVFANAHVYRARCSRDTATRVSCSLSFRSGLDDYAGKASVYYVSASNQTAYWTDQYTMQWVSDQCSFHSHSRSCHRRTKRGVW